jgi:hypothetical protein
MAEGILEQNQAWVDGTTSPTVDTFVWVVQGKTPTTGRQHVKVVDAPSMQGVWVYDFPSDSSVFVHRENITHLKAAIALAEPLLGL